MYRLLQLESGILTDMSDCLENPIWPTASGSSLKKSSSTITSASILSVSSGTSSYATSITSSQHAKINAVYKRDKSFDRSSKKLPTIQANSNSPSLQFPSISKTSNHSSSNNSISDAYLNEGNVTVHL